MTSMFCADNVAGLFVPDYFFFSFSFSFFFISFPFCEELGVRGAFVFVVVVFAYESCVSWCCQGNQYVLTSHQAGKTHTNRH